MVSKGNNSKSGNATIQDTAKSGLGKGEEQKFEIGLSETRML
jgi:hypothetical protein